MLSKLLNLMGNQLVKGYNIEKEPKGQAGCGSLWKLYDGTKQGSGQPVSVFIIDKKSIKKAERDEVMKMAKKEPSSLAKFKHPGILSLTEPLVEDQNNLAFVTERVQGNLQHFIQKQKLNEVCSSELEVRIQLVPLLETLNFIHNTVKMAHLAVNPENIYITADGRWKLAGFVYSQPINMNKIVQYEGKQPDWSYLSPQMALHQKCTYTSDVFSFMVLILNLVRVANEPRRQYKPLMSAISKSQYERNKEVFLRIESHPYVVESQNSPALARLARECFQMDPQRRFTIQNFMSADWLNDNFILTIKHLEAITDLEQKKQLEFIKGMEQVLFRFEHSIIKRRILPALVNLLKFDYLIAVVLIVIVEILKRDILKVQEFQKTLWTPIKNITTGKEMPAHALYVLVDNIDVWGKFTSMQDLQGTIVPLYLKCYECPNKLKELALKKIEYLSRKFDYQFLKTKILPRLLNLINDKTYEIRKYSLIALYKTMSMYDAQTVSDQIIPGLEKNRKAGTDPFVNAITLKLYGQLAKNLSIEVIGTKIIPSLIPYLIDTSITKNDFEMYRATILGLINKIQEERSKTMSSHDGPMFGQADFDFAQEEKAERKQAEQPNFDFLMGVREVPQEQHVTPVNNGPSGDFDFGMLGAPSYTPPTAHQTPIVVQNTPPMMAPTFISPKDPQPFNFNPKPKETAFKLPTNPTPKQSSIQNASDDFFNSLGIEQKPAQKPAFQFKGPPIKNDITKMSPPKISNTILQNLPKNISMNTGGASNDPFAQLEQQLRNETPKPQPSQISFKDIDFLSGGQTNPPKAPVKKPTPNISPINNNDFFDLL